MAVRIYSLAKELNIDNKELVSICEKAGLRGKGSALASLDDDEVIKVKKFISQKDASSETSSSPVGLEAVRAEKPARPKNAMRDLSAKQRLLQKAKPRKKDHEPEATVNDESPREEIQLEQGAPVEPDLASSPPVSAGLNPTSGSTLDPVRKGRDSVSRQSSIRDLSQKRNKKPREESE